MLPMEKPIKTLTLQEPRARIANLRGAWADIYAYTRKLRLHDYPPGQAIYYLATILHLSPPHRRNMTKRRRALIGSTVLAPQYGDPYCGGTVYLCTADSDGNMVSYIQSNYMGFGSGVVVPGTGVSLQNRGCNFYLDPASDNCIQPGKRPYHTIIPGFLSKDGRAIGPFGVMGGFMQPQGHFQVVTNTIDFHMNPQEALDAPRWQWVGDKNIEIERSFSPSVTEQLIRMGHNVTVVPDGHAMGSGQIIWRTDDGTLMGGTEPRADGCVALY